MAAFANLTKHWEGGRGRIAAMERQRSTACQRGVACLTGAFRDFPNHPRNRPICACLSAASCPLQMLRGSCLLEMPPGDMTVSPASLYRLGMLSLMMSNMRCSKCHSSQGNCGRERSAADCVLHHSVLRQWVIFREVQIFGRFRADSPQFEEQVQSAVLCSTVSWRGNLLPVSPHHWSTAGYLRGHSNRLSLACSAPMPGGCPLAVPERGVRPKSADRDGAWKPPLAYPVPLQTSER
jgi:hypothetical protein